MGTLSSSSPSSELDSTRPSSPSVGVNLDTTTRHFLIPSDLSGNHIDISIKEPNLRADNLSLETWASSSILADLLRHQTIPFPVEQRDDTAIIPILELGAGTGLVGITAQTVWKQPVVLSDLEPIMPGLQQNIDINSHLCPPSLPSLPGINPGTKSSNGVSRVGTLDWHHPDKLVLYPDGPTYDVARSKAHVILAADTVYDEEHPELLISVISRWLAKNDDSRVIIAYALRVAYLDVIRDLWVRFEEAGLESVADGQGRASETDFDDELLVEWSVWRWKKEMIRT